MASTKYTGSKTDRWLCFWTVKKCNRVRHVVVRADPMKDYRPSHQRYSKFLTNKDRDFSLLQFRKETDEVIDIFILTGNQFKNGTANWLIEFSLYHYFIFLSQFWQILQNISFVITFFRKALNYCGYYDNTPKKCVSFFLS